MPSQRNVACCVVACAALAVGLFPASHVLADVGVGPVVDSYTVSGTFLEGDPVEIELTYSVPDVSEIGPAGTTTRQLVDNSVMHRVVGSGITAPLEAETSASFGSSQTHSVSFVIPQQGMYEASYEVDVTIGVIENSNFGDGKNDLLEQFMFTAPPLAFTVQNVPPTVVAAKLNGVDGSVTVSEGEFVSAQMSSTDPGADFQVFTIGGLSAGVGAATPGTTRVSSVVNVGPFTQDGVSSVAFEVNDGDAAQVVSRTVHVLNVPPTITSTLLNGQAANASVPEGSPVIAQMSSTDPGADPQTFTIQGQAAGVGGNTPGSTRTSNAVDIGSFNQDGTVNISFQVADDDSVSTTVRTLTVTNVAPTVFAAVINDVNGDAFIMEGSTASFRASSFDPGADPHTFTISGTPAGPYVSTDSATTGTRTSEQVTELFADDGVFTINFNVADDDTSVDVQRQLTVVNAPPMIETLTANGFFSPSDAIPFSALATDPGVNDVLTFSWDFDGDGIADLVDVAGSGGSASSDGTIPPFFFAPPPKGQAFQPYNGLLTVTDGDGGIMAQPFSLFIVPEPSALAIAGLGAVAWLLLVGRVRRRK